MPAGERLKAIAPPRARERERSEEERTRSIGRRLSSFEPPAASSTPSFNFFSFSLSFSLSLLFQERRRQPRKTFRAAPPGNDELSSCRPSRIWPPINSQGDPPMTIDTFSSAFNRGGGRSQERRGLALRGKFFLGCRRCWKRERERERERAPRRCCFLSRFYLPSR